VARRNAAVRGQTESDVRSAAPVLVSAARLAVPSFDRPTGVRSAASRRSL